MGNKKIFLIIGAIILIISVPAAIFVIQRQTKFKLGAQNQTSPENVRISNVTEQTATITWTTQKASQGLISYGISPTNLTLVYPENTPAVNHQISLTNLLPGTNYFFVIKIEDKIFDNNGQPYSFTTKARGTSPSSPSPTPTSPLLTEEDLEAAIGTNNSLYDLNKDGIVNTLDLLLFRQQKNK